MHTEQVSASAGPTHSPPEIVSKGEFAALLGVHKSRVSQYISSGRIDGAALVGEGREQRIRVAVACEQLRRRLDPGQRLGNGLGTRLTIPAAPPGVALQGAAEQTPAGGVLSATQPTAATASASAPPSAGSDPTVSLTQTASDGLDDRIRKARLEGIERDNRKKAEEEAARAGRYVLATDTKAEMTRLAREMLTVFDGALADLAAAVAAKFSLPPRDVVHLLRTEFRAVRARAATMAASRAGEIPDRIDDEPGTELV